MDFHYFRMFWGEIWEVERTPPQSYVQVLPGIYETAGSATLRGIQLQRGDRRDGNRVAGITREHDLAVAALGSRRNYKLAAVMRTSNRTRHS